MSIENPGLLVIPCYREGRRLPRFLPGLLTALDNASLNVRVLVVDDGSGKQEQDILETLCGREIPRHPALLPPLLLDTNQGKGGAVMAAWDTGHAAGWYGFVDADGACSASETVRLASMLEAGGPAIIASRIMMLGRNIYRSHLRHLAGRIYATLVSCSLHIPVYDSQCGLKFVPGETYRAIRKRLTAKGFAFDVDLIAAIHYAGYKISEIPIDWEDIPNGKASLWRHAIPMAMETLGIAGKYSQ